MVANCYIGKGWFNQENNCNKGVLLYLKSLPKMGLERIEWLESWAQQNTYQSQIYVL